MRDISPESPEARRKRLASMRAAFGTEVEEKLKPSMTAWEVVKRVAVGVYNDGFIHAGNLAYLSIVALFPFFIVAAAVAHLLGQGQDASLDRRQRASPSAAGRGSHAARTDPGGVDRPHRKSAVVRSDRGPVDGDQLHRDDPRHLKAGLWREVLRTFWEYRLGSMLMILGAVLLLMIAFAVSAALTIAHHFIIEWFPLAQNIGSTLGLYRLVPAVTLFGTFYLSSSP